MAELPDSRKQKFLPYIRRIGDMYGLKDWFFEIAQNPPNDNTALASIYCVPGRRYGYIYLAQSFLDETPEQQRMIVLHELTHCHIALAHNFIKDHFHLQPTGGEEKKTHYTTLMEYGVDAIANSIANLFPLPENL